MKPFLGHDQRPLLLFHSIPSCVRLSICRCWLRLPHRVWLRRWSHDQVSGLAYQQDEDKWGPSVPGDEIATKVNMEPSSLFMHVARKRHVFHIALSSPSPRMVVWALEKKPDWFSTIWSWAVRIEMELDDHGSWVFLHFWYTFY